MVALIIQLVTIKLMIVVGTIIMLMMIKTINQYLQVTMWT